LYRKKGIINLIKPPGITSFGAIGKLKKLMNHPKAGHTGTLDPRACGVLPVCFGKATKVIPYLPEGIKEYIAEITLGTTTNTLDAEGEILTQNNKWNNLNEDEIINCVNSFEGEIKQVPPMFSAVKQDGERLYKKARKGKKIKRKKRKVSIYKINIISIEAKRVRFKVSCSRGTYIRSLAHDIGEKLGVGAYLSFLIRTRSGPFNLKKAFTYNMIEKQISENKDDFLFSLDWPLNYPKFALKEESYKKAINGAILNFFDFKADRNTLIKEDKISVYSHNGEFISINEVKSNKIKALRVFY